jgi:hypothetical protein
MLSSIGIFAETKKEGKQQQVDQSIRRFELTPMASLIQSEAKNSIRNFALIEICLSVSTTSLFTSR